MQYIGESERTLRERFLEHRGYDRRKEVHKSTGHHFNLGGRSIADMTISVAERITSSGPNYREEREKHWIEQFESLRMGINRKR